jgi:hypothetical protein
MHEVGAAAHQALRTRSAAGRQRAIALLALAPGDRQALEGLLREAGFEVRHTPSVADAPLRPADAASDAFVLLGGMVGGVALPGESTPEVVAALREAGWEHVVVVGADTRPTVVARALATGARGFLVAAPGRASDAGDRRCLRRAGPRRRCRSATSRAGSACCPRARCRC